MENCNTKTSDIVEESINEEVLKAFEQQTIDYVRFTFADINGVSRGTILTKEHAKESLKNGIKMFCGTITLGPRSEMVPLKEIEEAGFSNARVQPMNGTFHLLPWSSSDGKYSVGEFLCETFWIHPYRDGSHQAACPRFMARQQLGRLSALGYNLYSAFEAEFCVYEKDRITPVYQGYDFFSNILVDQHADYLYGIERRLRESGIDIITLHTEYAPGQFEVSFNPLYGISAADQMFRFKDGVKAMSNQFSRFATFMTKPNLKSFPSGLHYNHSLWSTTDSTNAFHDPNNQDGLSDVAKYWIAGLVKHAPALTALCSPTLSCYRRLSNLITPSKANWGIEDRNCSFRVKNQGPKETYVENRLAANAANPYLVMAGTVAAGIDGILNRLECPPEREAENAAALGRSLEESLRYLEEDQAMRSSLGEEFIRWFTTIKREAEIKKTKDLAFDSQEAFEIEKELYLEFV